MQGRPQPTAAGRDRGICQRTSIFHQLTQSIMSLNIINRRSTALTPAEETLIEDSFDRALCMAREVSADIDRIWDQEGGPISRRRRRVAAWVAHPTFVAWFGDSSRHILIRRVRRRIHRLCGWLENARIAVVLHDTGERHCGPTTNGFSVIPRRPVRVHLCPPWFSATEPRRAAIIIHELVHQLGFGHPEGTTTRRAALALALRNSRKARRSPENFEHLYEAYCSPLI